MIENQPFRGINLRSSTDLKRIQFAIYVTKVHARPARSHRAPHLEVLAGLLPWSFKSPPSAQRLHLPLVTLPDWASGARALSNQRVGDGFAFVRAGTF
jgi:hypothetical protein